MSTLKKYIIPICSISIIILTFIFINPITDKITKIISNEPLLVLKPNNTYTKNTSYLYVQRTKDFIPYSYQDLLNIYYSVIDNGWDEFTFYCPYEYKTCLSDA